MVARRNLKPTLGDALARLKASVEAGNTRAHGIKVATAGEGLELADSSGGATLLEGDTLPETLANVVQVETLAARLIQSERLVVEDANGTVTIGGTGIRAQTADYSRKVELTPLGLTGGTRTQATFRLDGVSNFVTGTFQTAETGQRVKLSNSGSVAAADFYASNSTDDHLGVWYQSPDADVLNAVARVRAMSGASLSDNSPGIDMYPMRGTFAMRGRWQVDTDTFKAIELINTAGLDAGGWANVWVNYLTPFPTNNAMYFPLITADTTGGVELVATLNGQTNAGVRVQLNNKSGNKATGRIIVRIVTFCTNA